MKAVLSTEVDLVAITAFAEIARWEPRPELQRVCRAAHDHGALTQDHVEHVLPGLSPTAKNNLIRHLGLLRLIDEHNRLTPMGRRCATTGEAPSWELGTYEFIVASHPLFGYHVVHAEPTQVDRADRDFSELESLPSGFGPDPTRVWTSARNPADKFTLVSLPTSRGTDPRCRSRELDPATLVWTIDFEAKQNHWYLERAESAGEDGPRGFQTQPESVPQEQLGGLFASWEPRWNPRTGRVSMAYDQQAVAGRETFLRTFRYANIRSKTFGAFEQVVMTQVPVGPSSAADARTWAQELAVSELREADVYCPQTHWEALWNNLIRQTPLEDMAGTAPSLDKLAHRIVPSMTPRDRWLLLAAHDLSLE